MANFTTKKSGNFDLEGDGPKRDSDYSFRRFVFEEYDRIPAVVGKYESIGTHTGYTVIPINKKDQEKFSQSSSGSGVNKTTGLFKKARAKSTGNGEVSLWWLINAQSEKVRRQLLENASLTNLPCMVNQGGTDGADPDLKVGDTYLEVKSDPAGRIKRLESLGRFSRFGDFIDLVSIINAADNFLNLKPVPEPGKQTTSLDNLVYDDLKRGAQAFCDLRTVVMNSKDLKDMPVFKRMKNTFIFFDEICNKPGLNKEILKGCTKQGAGGEHIASHLFLFVASQILSEKPGFGNYLVNIPSGSPTTLESIKIDKSKLTADKFKTGNNFKIKGGALMMKLSAFFA